MRKYLKVTVFFIGIILFLLMIGLLRSNKIPLGLPFAFGPGVQDFTKDLTGNYTLYRNSSQEIFIAPDDGWDSETAIIPAKVIKMNVYQEFIIAERYGMKRMNVHDSMDTLEIPDKESTDYWILNTEENYVLKNLKKNDFKRKRESLKIPENISLIDVYEY
ncbi:DUF3997 domain-containing protein [Chryseobacterium sp. VD8]|uniref:DUF3997 domain-containing protein n=1 Tax=Chryseobacterium sp. VD8 TaxID=3081254 RepID=UPI00301988C9